MASKTQNCGKNRANWEKRLFIQVSVTPKLIELVEISHAPANFFYFVNQCNSSGVPYKKRNLWLYLTSQNLPDSQLCLESKTEPSVAKWGGHRTENRYTGRGGQHTYLFEVGTLHIPYCSGDTAHALLGWGHRTQLIGVGTPHNILRNKSKY